MSAVCAFRFFLRLRKDIGCHDDHCTKVWYPPGTEIYKYPGTDVPRAGAVYYLNLQYYL
jgi:hypothetical protein